MSRNIVGGLGAALAVAVIAVNVAAAQNIRQRIENRRAPATQQAPQQATQPAAQPTEATQQPQLNGQPRMVSADRALATWLVYDNQNEVAAAELAAQRSQDPDVQAFAKRAIQDHQQMLSKLAPLAGMEQANPSEANANAAEPKRPLAAATEAGRNAVNRQANAQQPQNRTAARFNYDNPALREGPGVNWLAIKQEMAQLCRQTVQRELEQKEGAEFDHCYIGQQIGAHFQALDTLQVFERHATGDLKQLISQSIPVVKEHLQQAKDIAQKFEQSNASNARGATSQRDR